MQYVVDCRQQQYQQAKPKNFGALYFGQQGFVPIVQYDGNKQDQWGLKWAVQMGVKLNFSKQHRNAEREGDDAA